MSYSKFFGNDRFDVFLVKHFCFLFFVLRLRWLQL